MADLIAKIMIILGPMIVAIGVVVFVYIHRERWQQEMRELTEPKGESWTISYVHDDATPERVKAQANELGITPEELIKRLVADYLRDAK